MRHYDYTLTIEEIGENLWENSNSTGCEEITQLLENALAKMGFNGKNFKTKLTLVRYTNTKEET